MRSIKQIQASRANGALSKGPVTTRGKQASSRNSTRHGLPVRTVVLEAESEQRFLALLEAYVLEFQPVTAAELSLVKTLTVAKWCQLRVWGVEKSSLDRELRTIPTSTHGSIPGIRLGSRVYKIHFSQ